MAGAIMPYLINKIDVLITDESKLISGVSEELGFLQDEFEYLSSMLREADIRRRKSDLVGVWTTQIRDVAYDTEDLIDHYLLLLENRRVMNQVGKIFNLFNHWKSYHNFGKKIQHINTRLRRISECKNNYGINLNDTEPDQLDLVDETTASQYNLMDDETFSDLLKAPVIQVPDIVSRLMKTLKIAPVIGWWTIDERSDKSASGLLDFRKQSTLRLMDLMNRNDNPQRKLITIVGTSGLGKTVLAEKMFDNVSREFDVNIWINVSEMFEVKDLLLKALKQVDKSYYISKAKDENKDNLKTALHKRLMNKKYLLIVDDIRKEETWDEISSAFPDNKQRSRVVFTTYNEKVARHVDQSSKYFINLPRLNEKESLKLFCTKVFSRPVAECPQDLVKLGKEFVEECRGIPFPIVVICGILIGKERKHDAWRKVLDRLKWYTEQDTDRCRQVLIFSYSCLPYYLRRCFVYFGLFPDHCEIEAKKLIKLWVAEGFVEAGGNQVLEEVADNYLAELVRKGLLQVTESFYHGGPVKRFRVHHLLRDLIVSEGRFMDNYTNQSSTSASTQRRLAIYSNATGKKRLTTLKAPNLRCLLVFNDEIRLAKYNKMLRVLDLEKVTLKGGVPKEIKNLQLLQYLGLRETGITDIPTFIGSLFKLQTLDLSDNNIKVLPKSIWKLKNLRQLLLEGSCEEIQRGIISSKYDFGSNLCGLKVSGTLWTNSLSNILVKQDCLRVLRVHRELVAHDMAFPSSLVELLLKDTCIQEDQSDILGKLPCLQMLSLDNSYTGKKMAFGKGTFPKLVCLNIGRMPNLSKWTVDETSMPHLRHLRMNGLIQLKGLPIGLRNVKGLVRVEVQSMPDMIKSIRENKHNDIIKHVPLVECYEDQEENS